MRVGIAIIAMMLSGCVQSPPGSDGVAAEAYVPQDVARIATACAKADFDPAATRQLLLAQGFVEEHRPFQHQLEKYPEGAKALTQGVTTPWNHPCRPTANLRFARASVKAAAGALLSEGFVTNDSLFFTRGSKKIRLQAIGNALGGPVEINIQPL